MRKSLKIIIISVASLIAVLLLVSLLAGPVAKSYINHKGPQLIGRTAHVDRLRANLFTGHVAVNGLQVLEPDEATPFVGIDTLDVSLRLRGLLVRKLHFRHITISGLDANIVQEGKTFNFTDIIERFCKEDTVQTDEKKPWRLGFYNVRLSHWHVSYADLLVGSHLNLNDVNLMIPGVYFDGREDTRAGLDLALADGGVLHTDLDYNMETSDFALDIALQQFNLQNVEAYLTHSFNISDVEGIATAQLKATGNLSSILKTTLRGMVDIGGIHVSDIDKQSLLDVDNISIDVDKIILAENQYSINTATVDRLRSRFELFRNGNTFSRLPKAKESNTVDETNDTTTTQRPPMKLYVGTLRINDAAITYADHTLPDPFVYPVTNLYIKSDNVTLDGDNVAVVNASLPHGGKLDIHWRGTLDDLRRHQDLTVSLQEVDIKEFSPYTVAYLAHPFTEGRLSFTSYNTIHNSQLQGDNHIDIFRPEVGERRTDIDSALNVPLHTALYLLKDKNDEVLIDIPVSGNLNDPKFNYMKTVWSTLRKLLAKVAGSPIRGAAKALGMRGDELEFIEFLPTQTGYNYGHERVELSNQQYYKLSQLAKIVKGDKEMLLILQQQLTATDSTAHALAEQRNVAVHEYLVQQGVPERQLMIVNAEGKKKKCGYVVDSELLEPDE